MLGKNYNNKRMRLTKVSDNRFSGKHPNGINVGYSKEGTFKYGPVVGERFYIGGLYTSTVTKIIDDKTFETENSTYRLEDIDIEP
jgi:endonuclease YncB( thermonuclease family)